MPIEPAQTTRLQLQSGLTILCCACSDKGKLRDLNEDCFGIDDRHALAIVADGMGGFARGEVASKAVVDTVLKLTAMGQTAQLALQEAHAEVMRLSADSNESMGATVVVASFAQQTVQLHWAGDSRAYLWRNGDLLQLTRDHSIVQQLLDLGAISPQEALDHPNRNVVTRAVGIRNRRDFQVDSVSRQLQRGDTIVLCTDGLYGYLGEPRMAEMLGDIQDSGELAGALVERTLNETEAEDNITVVCLTVASDV